MPRQTKLLERIKYKNNIKPDLHPPKNLDLLDIKTPTETYDEAFIVSKSNVRMKPKLV